MSHQPTPAPRPSAARARIIRAADALFYAEGTRAVGVDRVIAEAQVTRVTFYRHFPSKDHLIAAYLDARLQRDREELATLRDAHPGDPEAVLGGIVETLVADTSAPGFRGCAYANIAAEFCDGDHPGRAIAAEHRTWLLGEVRSLLEDLHVEDADVVAEQLLMLRAGAMAVSSVGHAEHVSRAFSQAWSALVDRAR